VSKVTNSKERAENSLGDYPERFCIKSVRWPSAGVVHNCGGSEDFKLNRTGDCAKVRRESSLLGEKIRGTRGRAEKGLASLGEKFGPCLGSYPRKFTGGP